MSKRPAVTGWVKSKDTGTNINLFAFWDGDYGLSGRFEESVKSITLETSTGEEITIEPSMVYLNGKLEAQYLANNLTGEVPSSSTPVVDSPSADSIPF